MTSHVLLVERDGQWLRLRQHCIARRVVETEHGNGVVVLGVRPVAVTPHSDRETATEMGCSTVKGRVKYTQPAVGSRAWSTLSRPCHDSDGPHI